LAYISSKKDEKFNPLSERYKKSIINEESSKELEGIFDWAKEVTKEEKVSLEKQRELLEGYIIGGLAELKEKTEKMGSKEKDKNKIYEDIAKLFNIVKLIIRIRTEENTKSKIIEEKTHYFFEQIKSLSETFLEQNEKKDFDKWLSSLKSELLE